MSIVACLGDSITNGALVNVPYPVSLARLLGPAWVCGNHGVFSDTVSQMQSRYTSNIAGKGYDRMVVLGGVNDLKAGTPAATIFPTLKAIYDAAVGAGLKLVLVTVLPYSNYVSWSSAQQTELVSLNASITAYVASNPTTCRLWDGYTAMGGTPSTALAAAYDIGDGLHPNQAGEDFIASSVAAVMP